MGERRSRKKNLHFLVLYTVLFGVCAWMIYGIYFRSGKSLLYDQDAVKQHFHALVYYGKYLRTAVRTILQQHSLAIPEYSFSIGYGADIWTTLAYYAFGDPLNLPAMFIPVRNLGLYYSALIVLRSFLSGLAFAAFCFYINDSRRNQDYSSDQMSGYRNYGILAGALTYAFCGFMLYRAVQHPFYANPMIYLPLLLIGADRILRGRKPGFFVFMVAVSAVSNYRFFYMLMLVTLLYVLLAFAAGKRTEGTRAAAGRAGMVLFYALAGTLLCGAILLPVILAHRNSFQAAFPGMPPLFYPFAYYEKLTKFFSVSASPGAGTWLGFPLIALGMAGMLAVQRRRHKKLLAVLALGLVFLLLPAAAFVFNGFGRPVNDWCWAFAFVTALVIAQGWEEFYAASYKQLGIMLVFYILYYFDCMDRLGKPFAKKEVLFSVCAAEAAILITAAAKTWKKIPAAVCHLLLVLTVAGNLAILGHYAVTSGNGLKIGDFQKMDSVYKNLMTNDGEAVKAVGDEGIYRYTGKVYDENNANSTLISGMSGVQSYWSLTPAVIPEYMSRLELGSREFYNYKRLDDRAGLNALAGVKYYVTKKKDSEQAYLPYGFDKKCTLDGKISESYDVWENRLALPFGYVYTNAVSEEEAADWDGITLEQQMLQNVILKEVPDSLKPADTPDESVSVEFTAEGNDSVTFEDGCFKVEDKDQEAVLNFIGLPDSETFLQIRGLSFEGKDGEQDAAVDLVISSGAGEKKKTSYTLTWYGPEHASFWGRRDFSVHTGYDRQPRTWIRIRFPRAGTYSFDSLQVICRPMASYEQRIRELSRETLQQVDLHNANSAWATSEVTGTVTLADTGVLCLAVPYAQGWKAYVDDRPQKLLKANLMYSGLLLDAGAHEIRLVYHTPGKTAGRILTLAGVLLLIASIFWKKKHHSGVSTQKDGFTDEDNI